VPFKDSYVMGREMEKGRAILGAVLLEPILKSSLGEGFKIFILILVTYVFSYV
jgi:hypothetical protein